MAEPPIRRPADRPPPIPSARGVLSPNAAKTEVQPHVADELPEDTRNLEAPDAGELVTAMLDLVATEAGALLARDDSDGKLADLNVRTALASWDALHQPDEAMRLLELAEGHPLVPRLRLSAAIGQGPDELAFAEARSDGSIALAVELAEAWLWRHARVDRAAELADRVLAHELAPALRAHVGELAALAHAVAGRWDRVVELRRAGTAVDRDPEEIAANAALLLDRAGDAASALAACWTKLEHFPGPDEHALGWLRTFDIAIAAATVLDDARRFELLEKRAELVAALPGGALEALATRHAVASELDRDLQHSAAAALWLELADDPAAQAPGAARRTALVRAAWSAAGARDPRIALAAHRKLADSECREVAATHAWRALELAALAGDQPFDDLAHAVVDAAGSTAAERWLDQLELQQPNAATLARFEARNGLALRWAAAIAERRNEPAKARQLWQDATAATNLLPTTGDHCVRLLREVADTVPDGYDDELAIAYGNWARSEPDPRCAAALWCAKGIVDLVCGDFVGAEESLQTAARLAPEDPFCRAALAAVYRAGRRYDALATVLAELARSLTSSEARAAAGREHAELLDEFLGDPAGARASLEQMIADRPDDESAMLTLARLCERDELWDRAVELRQRAAELAGTPARRAEIWFDIARLEERRLREDAAIAAYARAAENRHPEALREQARVHRASGRPEKALQIVRGELAAEPPLARRMRLLVEQAQLLTELDREPEGVVAAYLEVLSIEPDQTEALAGIEEPARKLGLWDELARAFRGAPQTPRNLEVLGEALEKIAEWSELAEVRRRQLEAAATPQEKAQRAGELAVLYERELGDLDAAMRMLVIAQGAHYDDARQHELLRLMRDAQRWSDLAAVLERELPKVPSDNVERQTQILLELADLRATKLDRAADAVTSYEAVLDLRPGDPVATAALEGLYERTGRDRELARLLEARAEQIKDPQPRAQLFAKVATMRSNRGDTDGAIAAYRSAFTADPTNRDVFTAMERVCYKAERWDAAMQLYATALAHVESGQSRAYRLGDLYARRGNVQLNFLNQVEDAIASYSKVIEVDSQPTVAIKALEALCAQRGDWEPLVKAYEKRGEFQKDAGRRAEALRTAAQLAQQYLKDQRASLRINQKLLALDPADSKAAERLEQHYEQSADKSGLVAILKLRLEQARDDEETVSLMKRIARTAETDARDVVMATQHYMKVLELRENDKEALESLSRIYESTEQWAEYIDITRKLIRVTTDRNTKALLYFRCGSVMEAKFGREADAIRYYDAAIKTSPSCLPAVHGLRDLYRRREEWPRVIETLELEVKLWQEDKERAGVFAQIGRIHEKQLGDIERALQFYESALSVDPECVPANQALFDYYFDQRAWDKALPIGNTLSEKAMREGDPATRSDFYRKRGVVARMTGDPRTAADALVAALEIRPTSANALDDLNLLALEQPDVWDFDSTYRELEKVYRKREDANTLMARVLIGRAAIIQREGDLDQAAELYRQAVELAPAEFTVVSALVDYHSDTRNWGQAVAAIDAFCAQESATADDRLAAMMRQIAIHADGEMDAMKAIAVLREVIRLAPAQQDAHYLLAQQCFLIGRYGDARAAIDRVIELATAPGQPLEAPALARYYYYKGRILDASGDSRSATSQYRRAIDYDPGYAPPALVLARRAADAGDQRQAETLLIDAAHAAMDKGGTRAAVPLQRGLARILLASGDRAAAIEAYRGILNVEPEGASDRVALAEIYAVEDPARAIVELRKVLDRDIHHAPAYRLLASFHHRMGDVERAHRVLTALDLLGFAEEADRATMQRIRGERVSRPLRHSLDDATRGRCLLTPAAREPLGEVFAAFAEDISNMLAQPSLGTNLIPARGAGEPRLLHMANEVASLYHTDAELFVGEKVPGLAAVTAFPRRLLVIDRALLAENDQALRFLFGYAFEAIRGGYAVLLQVGARQRRELAQLLRMMVSSDGDLDGIAGELYDRASPQAQKVLERHAGTQNIDTSAWIDGMLALAKRAGLVACDDFAAAIWMVARLSGERPSSHDETVALGSVLGGPDLVRFYLSDDYQRLRDLLSFGG